MGYATIGEWRKANPELARAAQLKGAEKNRKPRLLSKFPEDGTTAEQMKWFRREFLELASRTVDRKERAEYLKQAALMTMKVPEASGKANGSEAEQYREHLARLVAQGEARDSRDVPEDN